MAEVGAYRFDDLVGVIDQKADGTVDQFNALFGAQRGTGQAGSPLLFEDGTDFRHARVFTGAHYNVSFYCRYAVDYPPLGMLVRQSLVACGDPLDRLPRRTRWSGLHG
ncbi:hypothetical protein D3C76_588000 [compost metagenome]